MLILFFFWREIATRCECFVPFARSLIFINLLGNILKNYLRILQRITFTVTLNILIILTFWIELISEDFFR